MVFFFGEFDGMFAMRTRTSIWLLGSGATPVILAGIEWNEFESGIMIFTYKK